MYHWWHLNNIDSSKHWVSLGNFIDVVLFSQQLTKKRYLAEISLQQWADNFTAVCDCPSEVGCHFFRSRDFLSVLFVVGISL